MTVLPKSLSRPPMHTGPVYVSRVRQQLLYPLRARPSELIYLWPGGGAFTWIVTDPSGKIVRGSRDMAFGEVDGCAMKLEEEEMVTPWLYVRSAVAALSLSHLSRPA